MNKIIIKLLLKLHSFCYNWSSFFAIRVEKGVHPKHRLTNYHSFFVDNINIGDNVLDVGCGKGVLAYDISKKAEKVTAIDIDSKKIKENKKKFAGRNIKYISGDATKDLENKKFDVVILSNVLEHIENRIDFLRKMKRLAPKILIRIPLISRDWITLYKKELGLEYRLHRGHYIEYTLESFKGELNQAELEIKSYSIQFGEIWAVINF
ncbi:MAG: methyltransferase domain-containing protein [Chitinivibrionales bacterium]|nr:methyltransferase domain-containing protein [Chitinivibrionales bacterium]